MVSNSLTRPGQSGFVLAIQRITAVVGLTPYFRSIPKSNFTHTSSISQGVIKLYQFGGREMRGKVIALTATGPRAHTLDGVEKSSKSTPDQRTGGGSRA